jgi:hypothetical protein
MRRFIVLAMVLATTLTVAGCSDSTGPQEALSGTYTLRSVNGSSSSPWLITSNASYTDEVLSSTISLDAQGNYSGTTIWRTTNAGAPPFTTKDEITGYWTLSGSTITLTDTTNPQYPVYYNGTISGSTITIIDPAVATEVYSK